VTAVTLRALSAHYGSLAAVEGLSLEIASGELVALLGPSGCGKTTTMRMIAGLLAPSGGDICFDGRSVTKVPAEKRGAVMVFQKHLLFPHMSVGENVAFGLKMKGIDGATQRRRVEAMLELVQLGGFAQRRPHALSGGQQQRVALARALVVAPQVLLLDEPLANLDANLRLEMRRLIRNIQQELNITTLFVTHDQEEAVMLADRVALMWEGKLLQFDAPRAFYARPASRTVARFFRNENFLSGEKRGMEVATAAGTLVLGCPAQVADGPVDVTVRPEEIVLAETEGPNTVSARIVSSVYMGTHVQLQVALGDAIWSVTAPAGCTLPAGEVVSLRLPPQRLWVLPGGELSG
jgi:ABC-type Fe3+/spermidine/putrescine transport system ATPase subunit